MLLADIPRTVVLKPYREGDPLTFRQSIDEAVVSIARAAFSAETRLLMPLDERFAPLVAYVAAEHLAPRFAEGAMDEPFPRSLGGESRNDLTVRIRSFCLPTTSKKPRGPRAKPKWINPYVELGLVEHRPSELEEALEAENPSMVIALGGGAKLTRALDAIRKELSELPIYSLRHCSLPKLQARREIQFFDDMVLPRFAIARENIVSEPDEERDIPSQVLEESIKVERRFEFVPYAIVAQLLVATTRG